MRGPATDAALARIAGLGGLEGSPMTETNTGGKFGRFYSLVGSKALAATTNNQTLTIPNETEGDFIAEKLVPRLTYTALNGAALAGTQLAREGTPKEADNTAPQPALVNIQIKVGSDVWFSAAVSIASLQDGNGEFFFGRRCPVVKKGQTVSCSVSNLAAIGLTLELSIPGEVVDPATN